MDNKLRAEKICEKLGITPLKTEIDIIASHLDEAVREAVKVDPLNHHYLEGFTGAIEQAAKIASVANSQIAELIRALRPKEGEIQ